MTAVIAITSGKAEVGRSLLSANLAHYLNHRGYRTGLLAAGSDKAIWSVSPDSTWPNIIGGRLSLDSAIFRDTYGIDLMVTHDHGQALGGLSTKTAEHLAHSFDALDAYAYLIVDMAAGICAPAIACSLAATETIMVLTPDTPALSTGYKWLAKLVRHGFNGPINIVLNQIQKPALAQSVYVRFRDLAQKQLKVQSNLWGSLTRETFPDPEAPLQRPLVDLFPQSKLLQEIRIIGDRLLAEQPPENQTTPLRTFWQQFLHHHENLPSLPYAPPIGHPMPEENHQKAAQSSTTGPEPAGRPPSLDSAQTFQQLNDQMAAILDELKNIRKLLENSLSARIASDPNRGERSGPQIQMNFDDFIARQEKTGQ
jgi:MinD-like ATPase involved in chromosome partitioning or flagellar assembly